MIQGFFGFFGWAWVDERQSIYPVALGMFAAAGVVLVIVWIVSR